MVAMKIPNSEFRIPNSEFLHRVGQIDEFYFDAVLVGDPPSESLDAEAFGGVVAGRDVVDAIFGGLVHDPFGGLAGHVGIEACGDGLMELPFGPTGHDTHR